MLRSHSAATLALLAALAAFGPLSTDMYLPSLPSMTTVFETDVARVQLTLSVFYFGFAVAQLIHGPLSDRFGRRPVLLGGLALYFAASLGCAAAPSIELLIAGRFVQALGASTGPVLGRAIVRDLFERSEGARVLSLMASAMALAPMLAPVIGGQLHGLLGWRANFFALAGFGALMTLACWRMVQETNRQRDADALDPRRLMGNFRRILGNRAFVGYTAVVACSFGALFSFISGSSFVIIDVLGIAPELFGFCFLAVVAGYLTGTFIAGKLASRLGVDRLIGFGAVGITLAAGVLASFAWAGVENVVTVVAPMSFVFASIGFILPTGMAGAVGPFPTMAGSASSLLGFVQLSTGAAVGAVVGRFHDGTSRPMATAIAVMAALTLIVFLTMVRRHAAAAEPHRG
jgi:DHA1 family bicyclomycin/chloramphenicol resistance-like MFS transporter